MYKLPLDPGRVVRATAAAFGFHIDAGDNGAADLCDGSGWRMRLGCKGDDGRVTCPICRHRVTALTAGSRLVELARHPASARHA